MHDCFDKFVHCRQLFVISHIANSLQVNLRYNSMDQLQSARKSIKFVIHGYCLGLSVCPLCENKIQFNRLLIAFKYKFIVLSASFFDKLCYENRRRNESRIVFTLTFRHGCQYRLVHYWLANLLILSHTHTQAHRSYSADQYVWCPLTSIRGSCSVTSSTNDDWLFCHMQWSVGNLFLHRNWQSDTHSPTFVFPWVGVVNF